MLIPGINLTNHIPKCYRRETTCNLCNATWLSLPPTYLVGDAGYVGRVEEFCVAFIGNWGSVTLIYGDKRKRMKPCTPGVVKGEPKPAAQLSFVPPLTQPGGVQRGPKPTLPSRTSGKGYYVKSAPYFCTPTAINHFPSSLKPTVPVELLPTVVVPVEQVAQKRKATSLLDTRPTTRPTITITITITLRACPQPDQGLHHTSP